ncbi:family 16 glycosylhydrolase [Phaeobacter porticola]|uniref:Glycosyl hydrolase family 16/Hemolysin-type calcium-binding protein repeat protein (2 copies) n=1 Tax=Phaeobacter porticola TaxID=1844006 RepID=A0A1L3I9Y3_9RHOB|nr:family 16 glycosylhydrolase [Phaeobacter porticola]APG48914.1 Glycosyl hydrolase family 16/Hemolysin-type calcium-binding protein repeat protein (2 copies) [Phaeobacter porticola]
MTSTDTAQKTATPAVDLRVPGQVRDSDDWLVSTWNAGQSSDTKWSADNVQINDHGAVELHLTSDNGVGDRSFIGGEMQSEAAHETGSWSWTAQAPEMQDGTVFGMFLFQEDYQNDRWLEFDFEFVGANTSQVQLSIHMETDDGSRVRLADGPAGTLVVDLGFDAAKGMHVYEIELTGTSAIFRVDGQVLAELSGADMPGGLWYSGAVKSFADLWAVSEKQAGWAGSPDPDAPPLVAVIEDVSLPGQSVPQIPHFARELTGTDQAEDLFGGDGADLIHGGAGADQLVGNLGADHLYGNKGRDILRGKGGDDFLFGGHGKDKLTGGGGDDHLDGGIGRDQLRGGGGADVFIFSRGGPADRVSDFNLSHGDALDLTGFQLHGAEQLRWLDAERGRGTRDLLQVEGEDGWINVAVIDDKAEALSLDLLIAQDAILF